MGNLAKPGRIFFGLSIAVFGFLTLYFDDFPYMMIPPKHRGIPGFEIIAYFSGALLLFAGLGILLGKKVRPISLVLGSVLLLIFCFYFIPYQLFVSKNNMVFGDWENAAKELTLASGALVIAGCFPAQNESSGMRLLAKAIPLGVILFALTIISYSVDHYLYAEGAAEYVPSWIPYRLFWAYFAGAALFASGLAILIRVKTRLAATLLGAMILSWFLMLHVPRIVVSPSVYLGSEVASAFLALAYSGIAFVIAGQNSKSGET
jgi:uncharacterized membrane protein YphA (DoxX/SURF4 family)